VSKSFLKPALAGFAPYVPGEQPPDGEDWIKLNTNESPLPPSPKVIEAIREAANDSLRFYPSPTAAPARAAIAKRFGLKTEHVIVGNGADELIEMSFRAFAGKGDRVAYPTPTYPVLDVLCRVHEVVPSTHPSEIWEELPPSLAPDPAPLKFVVNPNSPTGFFFPRADIEPVIASATGVVVVDEAYVDFAPYDCTPLLSKYEHLLILRTMSKSYGLAGMRIGFALGSPALIGALDGVRDSYNLDRLAIAAAKAAIEDEAHHRAIVDAVIEGRDFLITSMIDMRFDFIRPSANFVFVKPPLPAAGVAAALRERKILVRHYDREPIAGWLRITVGTRQQLDRLVAALKEILQ
jgi:histidinol-phosphate aminotransferase